MKKALSFILAFVLIFTFLTPASAGKAKCKCDMTPVVYVPGFGDPIYTDLDKDEPVSAFPPETNAITDAVPDLAMAIMGGLFTGNFDKFGTHAMKAAEKMLGRAALNLDGTAPKNSGIDEDNALTDDTHKFPAFAAEGDMDEGYFKFSYDWRLSPVDNAKLLKKYIDNVKTFTGHKKIVLACHSQGNTLMISYLYLYGSNDLEKIICLSPAYQGLSLIGALFTKEVSVSHKGEALEEYIKGIMGFEDAQSRLIVSIISLINQYGIIDGALNYVQKILDEELNRIYDECLVDLLGTMPGVWSFVPVEDYEAAKEAMFGNNKKYDKLIEKTDYYHDNIQTNAASLLKKAKANGTDIVISAGYNISSIPVTCSKASQSDYLIDTEYMSLGATCAPITETLGNGYKQAKKTCGHNHVSPENIIDASTCAFPEYTWFISGNGHNDFDDEYCEFIEWAIRYDGQPTVRSSKQYPQFMQINNDGLSPANGKIAVETRSDEEIIITSAATLIKESIFG